MFCEESMQAVITLWKREMIRFYRQPSRVAGALGTPFIFWLLIGSGIGKSFRMTDTAQSMDYLIYFFPGTILMILLFTAIFSTISLIEDRKEGFLQSVLVAPIKRSAFVLGKILGGASLAFLQAVLFLVIAPFIGIPVSFFSIAGTVAALFVTAFGLTALGFIIAWRLHSIQGFHAIMNLFLMPLWFLSGALFPPEGAPSWIRMIMQWNPLTYQMAWLREALYAGNSGIGSLPSLTTSIGITCVSALLLFLIASWAAGRRHAEDAG